jgi:hypothetical protein
MLLIIITVISDRCSYDNCVRLRFGNNFVNVNCGLTIFTKIFSVLKSWYFDELDGIFFKGYRFLLYAGFMTCKTTGGLKSN